MLKKNFLDVTQPLWIHFPAPLTFLQPTSNEKLIYSNCTLKGDIEISGMSRSLKNVNNLSIVLYCTVHNNIHLDVHGMLVVGLALVIAGIPLHSRVYLHLGLKVFNS